MSSLHTIFQKYFPVSYFDEGFFYDLITNTLNAVKKTKINKDTKTVKEKAHYQEYLSKLGTGDTELPLQQIIIYEHDIGTITTSIINEVKKYLSEDLQALELTTSKNDFGEGKVYMPTLDDMPGLFLKRSVLPIIFNEVPWLPIEDYGITAEQYFDFCFDSGLFTDLYSKEEIMDYFQYINDGNIDEKNFELFILCTERMINKNIIIISNRFLGCDNCKKYFLTSQNQQRVIREDLPVYFLYRHISDKDDTILYYKIDFIDINTKTIINDFNDFSIKRLIRKYNDDSVEVQQVIIEPSDTDQELPVIEISINDTPIKLLVGSTYNLYTTEHKLVGKIDILEIDNENGIGNISWIDKYPQKLLST